MAATAPANGETKTEDETVNKIQVPEGVILPPKSVREFIERASSYVIRNGQAFEDRLRQGKNKWTDAGDPYHPYYKWRIEELKAGRGLKVEGVVAQKTDITFGGREKSAPEPPEEFNFSARMPTISAQDLDTVKLTALWAAKNGKTWVTALSQKRSGEASFDFLRPQHSLNMFFNRLVEQYRDLIEGEVVEKGEPQRRRIAELEMHIKNRFALLDRARKRAEYIQHQEAQKVEKEEKAEKERVAFGQIDWHEFAVVETIVFDERDDAMQLRPPMTKNDLQSQSLEQKAAMRIGSDRRIEEAVPEFDYDTMSEVHPQAYPIPNLPMQQVHVPQAYPIPNLPMQQVHVPQSPSAQPQSPQVHPESYPTPPQESEASRVVSLQAEQERVRAVQEAARGTQQPTRIRNDYVPQAQRRKQANNTSICPNCKEVIPNDEMEVHMRIEMLDPRWREQSRINQQRSSTTNLSTADVANNLKRLASQRTDVFDPATGQALSEEEQSRRKRVESEEFAGTVDSQQPPPGLAPGTDRPDVQEQIRALHERYNKQ